jgi:hypothetical protein
MIPVIVIVVIALPVLGTALGFHAFAGTGAILGGTLGLVIALAAVAGPFWLLVRAEKAKARAPAPPPPDVPWA